MQGGGLPRLSVRTPPPRRPRSLVVLRVVLCGSVVRQPRAVVVGARERPEDVGDRGQGVDLPLAGLVQLKREAVARAERLALQRRQGGWHARLLGRLLRRLVLLDARQRDRDGYYWITGRVDDVLNVSGHRIGSAEIEHSLVQHDKVAEAAVVGFPHEVKGEGIFCYLTTKEGVTADDDLLKALKLQVRGSIGPFATPDEIIFTTGLPKTRSGKIMRRILRKIAAKDTSNLGDTSTLADPSVVDELKEKVLNR